MQRIKKNDASGECMQNDNDESRFITAVTSGNLRDRATGCARRNEDTRPSTRVRIYTCAESNGTFPLFNRYESDIATSRSTENEI